MLVVAAPLAPVPRELEVRERVAAVRRETPARAGKLDAVFDEVVPVETVSEETAGFTGGARCALPSLASAATLAAAAGSGRHAAGVAEPAGDVADAVRATAGNRDGHQPAIRWGERLASSA